ncbi:UDP-GlcNAc:undecaprenyl-phosphate GlcNAc-1-phosphate transferase [Rhizobium sp. BK376]|nr:UDP-GlcNAc:undecaprenyl-phosphate GlcNAc-1-phosphate transferase [Rhizobium sp. BK376]
MEIDFANMPLPRPSYTVVKALCTVQVPWAWFGVAKGADMEVVISNISIFVLCVALIVVLRKASVALALVDHPDARKQHVGAVPLCGGLAIFTTFALVNFVSGHMSAFGLNFWVGLFVVVAVGTLDDRHPLPASLRLIMQFLVAAILIGGLNIGQISSAEFAPGVAASAGALIVVVGLCFIAGLMNSWNMIDGVDGLAGGAAVVALVWLMLVAEIKDMGELILPFELLLTGLCGFLIFNMRSPWRIRASIFLGDAGSMALGATIAYGILLLASDKSPAPFMALLWIVIIPVTDTLSLMIRRVLAGRSPMSADRWHLHHLLLDAGFMPMATTNIILVASAVCGGIGYLGIRNDVPEVVMAAGLLIPVGIHTLFVMAASGSIAKLRIALAKSRRSVGVAATGMSGKTNLKI